MNTKIKHEIHFNIQSQEDKDYFCYLCVWIVATKNKGQFSLESEVIQICYQ